MAVGISIVRAEKIFGHPADTGMVRKGLDDFFNFSLTIIVAVDHIARHVRIAAIHIAKHAFLRNKASCLRKDRAAFDVIPVAVTVDYVPDRYSRKSFVEL